MKIKIFYIIFFSISIFSNLYSNEVKILAWVNNEIITSSDLLDQIDIKKNVYNKIIYKINYDKELVSLIEKKIKLKEITDKKIEINDKLLEMVYQNNLKKNNFNYEYLEKNNHLKEIIKEEIKIELSWINLIKNIYTWKADINLYEVENKVSIASENLNEKEKLELKKKIYTDEKNKKLQNFSNQHLALLQKKTYIKFNEK